MLELFKNKEKRKTFLGIMMACLFGQATNCFSLMLSGISEEFPTASLVLVQTVYSAAFYANPISSLLGGVIAKYMRKKQILIISHLLCLVSAMLVFVIPTSIPLLILIAGLIGVGAGFAGVSYNGLMAEHFTPAERASVFGMSSVFISCGGMIMSSFGGVMAAQNWKNVFLYFLILVPIIVLEYLLLPKGEKEQDNAGEGEKISFASQLKALFNSESSVLFLSAFLFGLVCGCFGYNISYMCDSMTSGLAYTAYMFASAVAGILSGIVSKLLKKFTMPVVIAVYTFALTLPLMGTGTAIIFMCGMLLGLTQGVWAPLVMAQLSNVVKPSQATLALGMFTGLAMLGTILYPYIITNIALMFNEEPATRFAICAVVTTVLAIINLVSVLKKPKETV